MDFNVTGPEALKKHDERIKQLEIDMVIVKKDAENLTSTIERLNDILKALDVTIRDIQMSPLKKYDRIAWAIVSLFIGYLFTRLVSL